MHAHVLVRSKCRVFSRCLLHVSSRCQIICRCHPINSEKIRLESHGELQNWVVAAGKNMPKRNQYK